MPSAKRPKAVEAWALMNTESGQIWATWTFDEKRDAHVVRPILRGPIVRGMERWVRVRIVPVPLKPKRRAARRKA